MADELIQAGIFEGMAWWNANPAKNFFSGGCMSPSPYFPAAIGGEGLGVTWPACDRQIMMNDVDNGAGKSLSGFYEDPPMVDCSTLQAMGFGSTGWNHHHIMSDHGDYTSTAMAQTDVNSFCPNSMMDPTSLLQGGEWSRDFNCSSSPPTTVNSAGNSSATDGSTASGNSQIPADTLSMFPNMVHLETGNPDWSESQVLGSPFAQQRQQQIMNDIRATLLGGSPCSSSPPSPPSQPQKIVNSKLNKKEEDCELSIKRRRIETPSSLPTFKVRKEKLGDRITALQQLVSPFGKTDTASVLHEAIEYVKFLHDQVNALSTPYMKNGALNQRNHQQANQNQKLKSKPEGEGPKQDLRSRGLCLVSISSTFPVAHETPADFWTPTFGANFR